MPNVTRGDRAPNLMVYLQGEGRANEHTEPHLVTGSESIVAWHGHDEMDKATALEIGRALEQPGRVHGTQVEGGHVWHCSLSLRAEEGQLSDEKWAAIAQDLVEDMGFVDPPTDAASETAGRAADEAAAPGSEMSTDAASMEAASMDAGSGRAPCRWVAVRHGLSTAGNDHIHIAVSLVREDGTKASVWRDFKKAQEVSRQLEQKYGLEPLEARTAGYGRRGVTPAEQGIRERTGAEETVRETLERRVRGYATASVDEAEFVRRCRDGGLLARPRFQAGRDDVVSGYSVALRPTREDRAAGQQPVWFGGGRLGRDLTLPRLRAGWSEQGPDAAAAPAAAAEQAGEAVAEWKAANRGQPVTARGREGSRLDAQIWERCHRDLGDTYAAMRHLAVDDVAGFAHLAHDTAGVFAAWSLRVEPRPGPLANAARELSRYSQVHAHRVPIKRVVQPGMREAAMLVLHGVDGSRGPGSGAGSYAILLRQLENTLKALHDHHEAAGRLQAARQIETIVRGDLASVGARLPAPPATLNDGAGLGPRTGGGGPLGEARSEEERARAAARVAQRGQPAPRVSRSPLPSGLPEKVLDPRSPLGDGAGTSRLSRPSRSGPPGSPHVPGKDGPRRGR